MSKVSRIFIETETLQELMECIVNAYWHPDHKEIHSGGDDEKSVTHKTSLSIMKMNGTK